MEEFFLKLAALLEEFYFLFLILVLAVATNAAANLIKAIHSGREASEEAPAKAKELPAHPIDDETIQSKLARIEKLLTDRDKPV